MDELAFVVFLVSMLYGPGYHLVGDLGRKENGRFISGQYHISRQNSGFPQSNRHIPVDSDLHGPEGWNPMENTGKSVISFSSSKSRVDPERIAPRAAPPGEL